MRLGGIHKIRHRLRRAEGVNEVSHFINSINAILHVSTKFQFVNVLFIFIPMFDLILLKNNLNRNKNNFGTAVLI